MAEAVKEKTPLLSSKSSYRKKKGEVSWFTLLSQRFQIWMMQHPKNIMSFVILPFLKVIQGLHSAKTPTALHELRNRFGPNFCVGGQVCIGDFDSIAQALTSPQNRTFSLVTAALNSDTLPMAKEKGDKNYFLLALSDKDAGGDGSREAIRKAILDVLFTDESKARRKDETAKKLFDQVAKDYDYDFRNGSLDCFFKDFHRGLNMFFIKYIHYVLFGLDPTNEKNNKKFSKLYYESVVLKYWLYFVGRTLQKFNVRGAKSWDKEIEEVVAIYEGSPALSSFQDGREEHNKLTRHEFGHIVIPLMGIAALGGTQHLAQTALGHTPLPGFEGHENLNKFDVTAIWDKLDLDNNEEIERYLFECGRLNNPVLGTHRVAESDFTTNIAGTNYTFPKGTLVSIPIVLGMTDEDFWGPTTYDFDHNRKNLCPYSMIFHSVGEKSGGRICPGRGLTLEMLSELLRVTGKMRRLNA